MQNPPEVLSHDKTVWTVFQRNIRSRTDSVNWGDPQFALLANQLYSYFRNASSKTIASATDLLIPYVELVRHDWGLGAVERTVRELTARGAAPRTLVFAAQLSARAGKDHHLASQLVSEIYAHSPHDPLVSLVTGQSLAAIGKFRELDVIAQEALARGAFTEWTLARWAALLVGNVRVEAAASFVKRLSGEPGVRELLEKRLESFTGTKPAFSLPTYLINLDREPRKWSLAQELLKAGGMAPNRVKAIDGRELPDFAHRRLGVNESVYAQQGAGAIATALSHILVWEKFLASGEKRCFIVEDDAAPYVHSSFHAQNFEATQAIDLVWANERMSAVADPLGVPAQPLYSPWEILGIRPARYRGVGADAYALTRAGAEKLLELIDRHGIHGHVDGQLGAYTIGTADGTPTSAVQKVCQDLQVRMGVDNPLTSACFAIPLVWANDHGVSNTTEISRDTRQSNESRR